MLMKAISFLGATNAYETTYCLSNGDEYTAFYFPAALVQFYSIDTLLVFVTAEARAMHYDLLYEKVKEFVPSIVRVDIPDGRNEAELWEIFTAVADAVEEEDRVIFDITHGFRSLPFLSFLAAAYLRAVKRVKLEAILYGAFEARDKSAQQARAPVFDLTRFVTLLDWLTAADHFVRFGDANELATLLRDREATPVHLAAATGNRQAQPIASQLQRAAKAMENVALPLRLTRPVETMQAANSLRANLDAAQAAFEQWARPFAVITDAVRQAYAPFGLDNPLDQSNLAESLSIQRDLIKWYLDKNQIIQAATLGQEWIISWAMVQLGCEPLDDRDQREIVSDMLGAAQQWRKGAVSRNVDTTLLNDVQEISTAVKLFHQLAQVRNDLNHAGFRENAFSANKLVERTEFLCGRLDELPLPPTS